jgi:hypothetical protein
MKQKFDLFMTKKINISKVANKAKVYTRSIKNIVSFVSIGFCFDTYLQYLVVLQLINKLKAILICNYKSFCICKPKATDYK